MNVRRTLDEVCTIHEFEPDMRTVFVEGAADEAFVDWFLWAGGLKSVAVRSIDTVNVPDEVLSKHGLPTGSDRSRVLALANELAERSPQGDLHVLCLVDRDFEDYRASVVRETYAAFTDCNSLELYAFTPSNMRKFVAIALGGLRVPSTELLPLLVGVLEQVYVLRLANELLDWRMQWIPFVPRYVTVQGACITFRRDAFIRAYLQKNDRWADRQVYLEKLQHSEGLLSKDATRRIRGHDLARLLAHVMRQMSCARKYADPTTLERSLLAAVERSALEGQPLFRRIVAVATG